MKQARHRVQSTWLVAVVAAIVLTGCGGSSDGDAQPEPTITTIATSTTETTPARRLIQVVTARR
jgi:ABC-type glycerol-3-phosphate transport system substrate-binding protein